MLAAFNSFSRSRVGNGAGVYPLSHFFARGMCSMLVAFNTFFETRDEAALFLLPLPWFSPHAIC